MLCKLQSSSLIGQCAGHMTRFLKKFAFIGRVMCSSQKLLNGIYCPCTPVSTSANALLTGYKQRFDNQSRSCNQGCSQYNSTCLYIEYRPTYPLYCDFFYELLWSKNELQSIVWSMVVLKYINLYSLVFSLSLWQSLYTKYVNYGLSIITSKVFSNNFNNENIKTGTSKIFHFGILIHVLSPRH